MESINLDDHTAYLTQIQQDISQHPHWNIMSCCRLLKQLENHNMDEKAERVRAVINKGLNSHAPTGKLSPSNLVYRAQVFHSGDTEEKRVNYRLVRQEAWGGPEYWSS